MGLRNLLHEIVLLRLFLSCRHILVMDIGILTLLHHLVDLLLGEINMRGGLILGLEQARLLSHHSVGRWL